MKTIAVFGACHIDTVANYNENPTGAIDVPGTGIDFSVGGAGYNAAVALRTVGNNKIRFVCPVVVGSLGELVVRQALKSNNISDRWLSVERAELRNSGGFVAISENGLINRAVTSTLYDTLSIDEDLIKRALSGADGVVIDSNIRVDQIIKISKFAIESSIPIFGLVVSDAKAARFCEAAREIQGERPYALICMNSLELSKVLQDNNVPYNRYIGTELLCVTNGSRGMTLYYGENEFNSGTYLENVPVANEVGAGDALFAGLVDFYMNSINKDYREAFDYASKFVRPILLFDTPTLNARRIINSRNEGAEERIRGVYFYSAMLLCIMIYVLAVFSFKLALWAYIISIILLVILSGAWGGYQEHFFTKLVVMNLIERRIELYRILL